MAALSSLLKAVVIILGTSEDLFRQTLWIVTFEQSTVLLLYFNFFVRARFLLQLESAKRGGKTSVMHSSSLGGCYKVKAKGMPSN